MLAHHWALEFYKQGQPAVIALDGQPLYQIINTSGTGDESTKPKLALVLIEGAQQNSSFDYPKQINLNFGGQSTAFYPEKGNKKRPVDLGANHGAINRAWQNTEAQSDKKHWRTDAISNLEQLIAVLGRCQTLSPIEAGRLLAEISQRQKKPPIKRLLGGRAK